jgi:hypothetical protein
MQRVCTPEEVKDLQDLSCHVHNSKSDHPMYSRLAGVGNLIPQSTSTKIWRFRVKEVGTGIGMIVHVRPRSALPFQRAISPIAASSG